MLVLSTLCIKNTVYAIVAGLLFYSFIYMYLLMYSEDYYPIFLKFAPYLLTIDMTITIFMSYMGYVKVEKTAKSIKTPVKKEKYMDMDDIDKLNAINVHTINEIYNIENNAPNDTLENEMIREVVYDNDDYLGPDPVFTDLRNIDTNTPVNTPTELSEEPKVFPLENKENKKEKSKDKVVDEIVVVKKKRGKPSKKEVAKRLEEALRKEVEDEEEALEKEV